MIGRWSAPVVYVGLTALCALAGYWMMFSQFAVYDDEGFFDYSLHLFITGHPVYTQVFSDYGPLYYAIFGGLFSLIGHGVTTDSGRIVQLVLWIATAVGMGLSAHRLSGRLAIGVTALATTFVLLTGATSEPMHASMLNDAVLTLIVAVAVFGLERHPRLALGTIGALAGALLLIKINIGGYAVIAIAFAAVFAGGWLGRWAPLRIVLGIALVVVGPAVMLAKLDLAWVDDYALLAVLSAGALVLAARSERLPYDPRDGTRFWAVWLIGGFLALVIAIVAIVLALGTNLGDLIRDVITVPSHQGSVLVEPISLGDAVIWWSLLFLGCAWLWSVRVSTGRGNAGQLWSGGLRALAGVMILLSMGDQTIFSISPAAAFSLAMPLAWVAALPSVREVATPLVRLRRLLLPALAVTEALVAYPVAGTQLGYGSILFVPCAAVCLADGWAELSVWWGDRSRQGVTVGRLLTALTAVLAIGCVWQYVIQSLATSHASYASGRPLTIPGATRLRLDAVQASAIETLVAAVHAHRCRALIGYPGLYSFDIWTGVRYVTTQTGEQPYWSLLNYPQQERVLRRALRTPGLCAIEDQGLVGLYGGDPQRSPIVKYLLADFVPVASASPYELAVRRRR